MTAPAMSIAWPVLMAILGISTLPSFVAITMPAEIVPSRAGIPPQSRPTSQPLQEYEMIELILNHGKNDDTNRTMPQSRR